MKKTDLERALDEALPDEKILSDVKRLLEYNAENGVTEIELNEKWVPIPIDVPIDIVSKAFLKEYYEGVGFGAYRVLVAIGGFKKDRYGFHEAGYCFATLYYNDQGDNFTEDYHVKFR
ncbi:hypothetical protein DENIS_1471 [Desulfonema ishimotonii]|uniref:Uncharacterized protein n=1 Tax=Desulfonema ishimotonii TaxID=45657 RepID=A0A401FU87_9BACT|nr:hypothetical protein [Desulfonema ishimotonii]GBC60514.1 hypothetical protein DENIS_1471 [Desulfonema ishimotonii]